MIKAQIILDAIVTMTWLASPPAFALSKSYEVVAVDQRASPNISTSNSYGSTTFVPLPNLSSSKKLADRNRLPPRAGAYAGTWKVLDVSDRSVMLLPISDEERPSSSGASATAAINAALVSGSLLLPCGNYTLDGPIFLGKSGEVIKGTNPVCTKLIVDFADGDVIVSGGFGISNTNVRNLEISARVKRTSGYAIDLVRTFHSGISDVVIDNAQGGRQFGGIKVSGANTTVISDVELTGGGSGFGYYITSAGEQQAVDTFISRSNVSAYLSDMAIDNASGIYLNEMDLILSSRSGLLIEPSGSVANVNALFAESVFVDSSSGSGWVFTGTRPITEVKLTNCWGSGSGTFGIGSAPTALADGLIAQDPALSGLSIQSSHFHHNGGNGIAILGGLEIQVGGGTTTLMNSAAGLAKADGVYIASPANFVQLNGIISGQGGYMSDVAKLRNNQRYGVDISSNESNSVIQADMILTRANAIGGVNYPVHSGTIQMGREISGN